MRPEQLKRNWQRLFIVMLLVVVMAAGVHALGIAPASTDVLFEPGLSKDVRLKILNQNKEDFSALVYAEGPLAEYITIHDPVVDVSASEDGKIISYSLQLPDTLQAGGQVQTKITVRQIPKGTGDVGTTLKASAAVASRLTVQMPSTGKHVQAKLLTGVFAVGRETNFAVEVRNVGTDRIDELRVHIDIYGPLGNKVASLSSPFEALNAKDVKMVSIPWNPAVAPGAYNAVAVIEYDSLSTQVQKAFSVGEPRLTVDSLSVDTFSLGEIAKFDIIVSSNWNLPIDKFSAHIRVTDDAGNNFGQFKTAEESIEEFGKQTLIAYWDTAKTTAGKYSMEIALKYLDKTTKQMFDIFVETDKITATPVGQVVGAEEGEISPMLRAVYILAGLVAVLVVVNVIILVRRKKK